MALSHLVAKIQHIAQHNSRAILTGVGVAGTISTAVLTGRASYKAAGLIKDAVDELNQMDHKFVNDEFDLELRHKVKLVWSLYIPPVGTGIITLVSIILANRLAGKQVAALAAAYSLSESAFSEYRDKVIEKIGENKETDVRDEIAQARVKNNPVNSHEVIIAGTGEVLCFDIMSGRYFQSSVEEIKKAENAVNFEIINGMSCSLSRFYDEIGLPATGFSDEMGFNFDKRCNVTFSTQLSSDGRPCVAIDFAYMPVLHPEKLWG